MKKAKVLPGVVMQELFEWGAILEEEESERGHYVVIRIPRNAVDQSEFEEALRPLVRVGVSD